MGGGFSWKLQRVKAGFPGAQRNICDFFVTSSRTRNQLVPGEDPR
jgi:hypothetical protein